MRLSVISRIIKAEVGVAMLCNSIIYTYENQPVQALQKHENLSFDSSKLNTSLPVHRRRGLE